MHLCGFHFILRSDVGSLGTYSDSDYVPYGKVSVKRLLRPIQPQQLEPPATGLRRQQQQQHHPRPSGERSGGATAFANFQVATS